MQDTSLFESVKVRDTLFLQKNKYVQGLLKDSGDQVIFSNTAHKYSRYNIKQERTILLTQSMIVLLHATKH